MREYIQIFKFSYNHIALSGPQELSFLFNIEHFSLSRGDNCGVEVSK